MHQLAPANSSAYLPAEPQQQPLGQLPGSESTWNQLMAALFQAGAQQGGQSPGEWQTGAGIDWWKLALALLMVLLMLCTAVGNLFVIVAILMERNLRTISNYLVISLAIADLLVALLVMPLASIYQILERWTLGVFFCDIWTSADVFCCTASILHLLAIALDRYWAVTRVDYIRCQRNERRILLMILCVWMAAAVISLAPVFGWKDIQYEWRILNHKECLLSQDVGFQIFATCTTFYFPLTLTLIFYWKIYQVARKRIRRKLGNKLKIPLQHPSSTSSNASSTPTQPQRHHKLKPSAGEASETSGERQPLREEELCRCQCHAHQSAGAKRAGTKPEEAPSAGQPGSPKSPASPGLEQSSQSGDNRLEPSSLVSRADNHNGSAIIAAASEPNQTSGQSERARGAPDSESGGGNGAKHESGAICSGEAASRPAHLASSGRLRADSGNPLEPPPAITSQAAVVVVVAGSREVAQLGAAARTDPQAQEWPPGGPSGAHAKRRRPGPGTRPLVVRLVARGAVSTGLGAPSGERTREPAGSALGSIFLAPEVCCRRLGAAFKRLGLSAHGRAGERPVELAVTCRQCRCATRTCRAFIRHSDTPRGLAERQDLPEQAGPEVREANAGTIAGSTASIAIATVRRPPICVAANSVQLQSATMEGVESKREKKAAKTLAIITGVFVMCWLPFFVMALTMPLVELKPPKYLFALLLWLGYVNSMLNPIIYTIFSPDFRTAFKRLLCGTGQRRPQHLNRLTSSYKNNNNNSNPAAPACNKASAGNRQNNSHYLKLQNWIGKEPSTGGRGCSAPQNRPISRFLPRFPPILAHCCLPGWPAKQPAFGLHLPARNSEAPANNNSGQNQTGRLYQTKTSITITCSPARATSVTNDF